MDYLRRSIERQWYARPHWLLLLAPLAAVFIAIAALRRAWLSRRAQKPPVPMIIVGNISVGGTGKTPVIISLVKALSAAGFKPGVISRGYGAELRGSQLVPDDALPRYFGDEPVLIKQLAAVPVAVGRSRIESAALLVDKCGCDLVLSDDGLQHYRLARDVELAVVDGVCQLGNGWRLPVGPLRESKKRLTQVDFVLINGPQPVAAAPSGRTFHFELQPLAWRNVRTGERVDLKDLPMVDATAIAGIGNPQRFFTTLQQIGFAGSCRAFADHHAFSERDFDDLQGQMLLMTEKDAVKCRPFATENWWALSIDARLPDEFLVRLIGAL